MDSESRPGNLWLRCLEKVVSTLQCGWSRRRCSSARSGLTQYRQSVQMRTLYLTLTMNGVHLRRASLVMVCWSGKTRDSNLFGGRGPTIGDVGFLGMSETPR